MRCKKENLLQIETSRKNKILTKKLNVPTRLSTYLIPYSSVRYHMKRELYSTAVEMVWTLTLLLYYTHMMLILIIAIFTIAQTDHTLLFTVFMRVPYNM